MHPYIGSGPYCYANSLAMALGPTAPSPSIIEVLTGLAPNYATFMILRALFGIGMGGEWGVGASLAMEKVPAKLRGVLSGLLQEGYATGYLLAAVCYFFVFPRWGWRPLFTGPDSRERRRRR